MVQAWPIDKKRTMCVTPHELRCLNIDRSCPDNNFESLIFVEATLRYHRSWYPRLHPAVLDERFVELDLQPDDV